jgi:hypothetical protein
MLFYQPINRKIVNFGYKTAAVLALFVDGPIGHFLENGGKWLDIFHHVWEG